MVQLAKQEQLAKFQSFFEELNFLNPRSHLNKVTFDFTT